MERNDEIEKWAKELLDDTNVKYFLKYPLDDELHPVSPELYRKESFNQLFFSSRIVERIIPNGNRTIVIGVNYWDDEYKEDINFEELWKK